MSKVYIVFSGWYSDRSTRAVFDNEKAAENYIENRRSRKKDGSQREDGWDIEEWEINSDCPLSPRIVWRVDMLKNGSTEWVEREPNGKDLAQEFAQVWVIDKGYLPEMKLICTVEATDEKHAVKIVNERRAMLIANNRWPDYLPNNDH